jgi:hypothetical protein
MSNRTNRSERRLSLGTLHEGQFTAYRALKDHRFKALRCGRRFGKTDFAKIWISQGLVQGQECAWLALSLPKIISAHTDDAIQTGSVW